VTGATSVPDWNGFRLRSVDHRPPGWIRQSRKCCTQLIHNHMVVNSLSMSSVSFAIPDFCSLISEL
jgi:hypothetical protein